MRTCKDEINIKGNYVLVDSLKINNIVLVVTGSLTKTARIKEEMYSDVEEPESILEILRESDLKPDIFTFMERLPGLEPKFGYYCEMEPRTILHVKDYDHWWNNQIISQARTKVRKAEKKGVNVKLVDFSDELVEDIMEIYNETPIRQGKAFWHYGKDFSEVKKDLSRDLDRSDFIGAYLNDTLIGFIKLINTPEIADPVLCISMISQYDKAPNNVLIAKMVEICAEKKIPHINYGIWRHDSHAEFLVANGFEMVLCPRYYCTLTAKGELALKLNLHRGLMGAVSPKVREKILDIRSRLIALKYRKLM